MAKIVKLRTPPTEEDRWRAIIKQAEAKLREAIKLLQTNKTTTQYSMTAAIKSVRQSKAKLVATRNGKPKKRMTPEEWRRRREKASATILRQMIKALEAGFLSEGAFERILLSHRQIKEIAAGVPIFWPAQVPLLTDAAERKVISAACYHRLMAANAGEFVGEMKSPFEMLLRKHRADDENGKDRV
jgi:hypothetical protein